MSNEQWSEWIEHNTNGCPVDGGMVVDIMKRDEKESGDHVFYPDLASNWDWSVDGADGDIIAYRYRLDDNTMTQESDVHPVLEWLARNVSEWKTGANAVQIINGAPDWLHKSLDELLGLGDVCFSYYEWLQARQDLGLIMSDEEAELPAQEWAGSITDSEEEGRKYDAGKAAMDLIPPYMEEEVGKVLAFGAQKYAPGNWRKVTPLRPRYLAAAQRHINALKKGEQIDQESGLHHAAHAVCCLMFLGEVELEK